jgi:hypothetical protein
VKNPNAIEVDEEMGDGSSFKVSLEKDTVPLYPA